MINEWKLPAEFSIMGDYPDKSLDISQIWAFVRRVARALLNQAGLQGELVLQHQPLLPAEGQGSAQA